MGHEFGNRFRASCQALIPEPWYVPDNLTSGARVQGSGVKLSELTDYTTGRDPGLDGPVGLQTERPTCRA